MPQSREYDVDALLADGLITHIRTVKGSDRQALVELYDGASEESRYRRFFSLSPTVAHQYVDHLCGEDSGVFGLMASVRGVVVGVATAEEVEAGVSDISVFVADQLHGRGLGTLLIEHLAGILRTQGISTLVADVLASNSAMLHVFRDAGFDSVTRADSSEVRVTMSTRLTPKAEEIAERRERFSERASMRHLLEPSSVAVVGVSASRGGVGREVVENLRRARYSGRLYAVGRHPVHLEGVHAVERLTDIADQVDLVVVAVPAADVESVVDEAAAVGVRGCVIVTAGFGEEGPEGLAAQERLVSIARAADMRIVGPNCFGLMSFVRETSLNATFAKTVPRPGELAIASQSGGVGLAILDEARKRDLGVASFVSLGNKADVSGNDLLATWSDDPDVHAVALYLESFGNPRKFLRLARTCSALKPILAVFGGSSDAGRRAGLSHTAASLTSQRFLDALCDAAGVIAVSGPQELMDTATLLLNQPLPAGPRLGVIGNAGGLGIVAADLAHRSGLEIPELGPSAQEILRQASSSIAATANPVDLGAAATPAMFASAVGGVLSGGDVDAVLVIVGVTSVTDVDGIIRDLEDTVADNQAVPLMVVVVGADADEGGSRVLTCFDAVEDAMRALAGAVIHSTWLRQPQPDPLTDNPRIADIRQRIRELPASPVGPGWLDPGTTLDLLETLGVSVPQWQIVETRDEVATAAELLGFPLVAKAIVPATTHKSDAGLVITHITDARSLTLAAEQLQQRAKASVPILLQTQASPGVELALGIVHEPKVGPMLMVATGGVDIDVWADQVFLLPPVSERDVRRVLHRLRSWPLLMGHRGRPAADVNSFVGLALLVSELAVGAPEIKELDLNPVIVSPYGLTCVDARVRLGATSMIMDGIPSLAPITRRSDGQVEGSPGGQA